MRIILGYLVGAGLLGFAIKLKKKFENFSAVLLGGSMATMYFIMESVPEERLASAQGVGFVLGGAVMGAAVFASGWIYGQYEVQGFWIMAAIAAVSLLMLTLTRLPQSATGIVNDQ